MKPLAIVIPAYKVTFFERTLASIARQTCKEFTLYVGNDCSSEEIGVICDKYAERIDIVYHRFDTNLGGKDLVAQWERCIGLTQGEPWIWLFSDDDVMGERCVELFLQHANAEHDLYHFDVKRINDDDEVIYQKPPFPERWSGKDMFLAKQTDKIDSFVVEYIFSRKVYDETGGFQSFPMAWGSDIATWVKFAGDKGIKTIKGDYVYWRKGSENITPQKSKEMAVKKLHIETDYYKWVDDYFRHTISKRCVYLFVRSLTFYSPFISYKDARQSITYAQSINLINKSTALGLNFLFPLLALAKRIKRPFQNEDAH